VTNRIEFIGGHTGADEGLDHFQDLHGALSCRSHFSYFICGFDVDSHL
jgi:hypothetical protein